ncbi:polysaccharide deacetylase family protein [Colwellia sp. BRX10-6]|jgi:peptidoglycan/xylan/chitin deacetylase (PgdA/CDA1 family)|uniref:polysaccharide deacetylase family protein n=1 Tax=unclassified Colwellia TaxID=196834 RepID=UPI0015F7816A|nr:MULTISPECIES: polysaccharide deacetylase family protein [unclassified Colwellia]MBA6381813.1 polysaccharide deacetylase family protein [Colwellia sp. BRX10-9]MBA6393506.1 polysaccharide deacetylase family protein [Colwellia sp. BRX10-6]
MNWLKIVTKLISDTFSSKQTRKLIVLNFHRVLPSKQMNCGFVDALDEEFFKKKIFWLKEYFNILPLDLALELQENGNLPLRAVAITIDDGYVDSYDIIFPILIENGISGAFFISTAGINEGCLWFDKIVEAINQTNIPKLKLLNINYNISTKEDKKISITKLVEIIKYKTIEERHHLIDIIYNQCGHPNIPHRFLSNDQIKEMSDNGMLIGAHTHQHPILMKESDDTALQEINKSKVILESIIQKPIQLLAYPNGKLNLDFDERHIDMLKKLKFKAALSSDWGVINKNKSNLFALPRFTPWEDRESFFVLRLAFAFKGVVR